MYTQMYGAAACVTRLSSILGSANPITIYVTYTYVCIYTYIHTYYMYSYIYLFAVLCNCAAAFVTPLFGLKTCNFEQGA